MCPPAAGTRGDEGTLDVLPHDLERARVLPPFGIPGYPRAGKTGGNGKQTAVPNVVHALASLTYPTLMLYPSPTSSLIPTLTPTRGRSTVGWSAI